MTFGRPLIFLVDIKIGLKHLEKQLQRLYFRTWLYLFYLIIQIIFIIIIIITVFLLQIMQVFLNKLMHLPTIVVFLHL